MTKKNNEANQDSPAVERERVIRNSVESVAHCLRGALVSLTDAEELIETARGRYEVLAELATARSELFSSLGATDRIAKELAKAPIVAAPAHEKPKEKKTRKPRAPKVAEEQADLVARMASVGVDAFNNFPSRGAEPSAADPS